MIFQSIKNIVMFVPKKLIAINESVDKIMDLLTNADKTFTYVTKVTGATTGAARAAKRTVDLAEAVVCQDGICVFVSAVRLAADDLQICTSFIPGLNITAVVTMPVSAGCKMFV